MINICECGESLEKLALISRGSKNLNRSVRVVLCTSTGPQGSMAVSDCHSARRYTYSQFPIIYYTWVTISFDENHFDIGDPVCSDRTRCEVPLHRLHSYAYLLQL
jgi:hypothetical protein